MSSTRALHLAARPEGLPKDSDFELRTRDDAPLQDGQIRIAVRYLSIDPAMRVWMTEAKSYWPPVGLGEVLRSAGIGEVVESRNEKFPDGTWVSGMTGVQETFDSDGKGMQRFDASALPHPGWALSLFGATGLTAYFGLIDIGKPKPGEVLVVSAAAGAVGSAVVQIGKALGMTVIVRASGPQGSAYIGEWYDNKQDHAQAFVFTGATPNVVFRLALGYRVSGRVTDASGRGIAGVFANANLASTPPSQCCPNPAGGATTGSDGTYSFVVSPGTYRVFFNAFNTNYISRWWNGTPQGAPDITTAVDLTVPPDATGTNVTL